MSANEIEPATSLTNTLLPHGVSPHESYYYEDGSIILIVEDTAYRLHWYLFQQNSPKFATTFPFREGETPKPVELSGVNKKDFEAFLSILYRTHGDPAFFSVYSSEPYPTGNAWEPILRLAHEWDFHAIRNIAVKEYERSTSSVDKVVYGRRYRMSKWFLGGYIALCERKAPLTLEECRRLDMEDVVAINHAREELRAAGRPKSLQFEVRQNLSCNLGHTESYTFLNTERNKACKRSTTTGLCTGTVVLPSFESVPLPSTALPPKGALVETVKAHMPELSS